MNSFWKEINNVSQILVQILILPLSTLSIFSIRSDVSSKEPVDSRCGVLHHSIDSAHRKTILENGTTLSRCIDMPLLARSKHLLDVCITIG